MCTWLRRAEILSAQKGMEMSESGDPGKWRERGIFVAAHGPQMVHHWVSGSHAGHVVLTETWIST